MGENETDVPGLCPLCGSTVKVYQRGRKLAMRPHDRPLAVSPAKGERLPTVCDVEYVDGETALYALRRAKAVHVATWTDTARVFADKLARARTDDRTARRELATAQREREDYEAKVTEMMGRLRVGQ